MKLKSAVVDETKPIVITIDSNTDEVEVLSLLLTKLSDALKDKDCPLDIVVSDSQRAAFEALQALISEVFYSY